MIISKIYNAKSSSNKKRNSISDPRVITPSSIPIFILPPTLDSYGNKPDLNGSQIYFILHSFFLSIFDWFLYLADSYDCWSVVDDENLNNVEYSHKRHSTTGADGTNGGAVGAGRTSKPSANGKNDSGNRAAASLENLNKLDIGPKGGYRNSSISSTSSTPNPQAVEYMSNIFFSFK